MAALAYMNGDALKAPFPWFGGKSRVAAEVWRRFGDVRNYVEPFFGSGAMLLSVPQSGSRLETVNDLDGYIANFWRAVSHAPDEVAAYCDWPRNENDLHARHVWLRENAVDLPRMLEGDPDYYDAKIAGWWCWGICLWIGSGWCGDSGAGPWRVEEIDGARQLLRLGDAGKGVTRQLLHLGDAGQGVTRQRLHLGDAGKGVTRQLLHLGNAGQGVTRQRLHLGDAGKGVTRQLLHLGDAGQGVTRQLLHLGDAGKGLLYEWFDALSERLRSVRVACGDWSRVCGPSVTYKHGLTGVFLDPPYHAKTGRDMNCYNQDDGCCSDAVREWAIAEGDNPKMRIALCGYEGEHDMPESWAVHQWSAHGGYSSRTKTVNNNKHRERIWFSPHCVSSDVDADIFQGVA